MSSANTAVSTPDAPDDLMMPLLDERTRLKEWLARVEESASEVPPHIADLVRTDYQARLRRVLDGLLPHTGELRARLEGVEEELQAAAAVHTAATDRMEETRLRYLAGELDAYRWAEQSPELRTAVEAAEAKHSRLREERERLSVLVAEIDPPADEPAVPETVEVPVVEEPAESAEPAAIVDQPPAPAAAEHDENLPWIELLDPEEAVPEAGADAEQAGPAGSTMEFLDWLSEDEERPAATASAAVDDDDSEFAFLQELDRAIADAPSPRSRDGVATAPAQGINGCARCGAANELGAWYCEKCGEEMT